MADNHKNYESLYDEMWQNDWGDMERFNPTARHLERKIIDFIQKLRVKSVIDVGCGMGVNLKPLSLKFKKIKLAGTDISKKSIEMARKYVGDKKIDYYPLDISKKTLKKKFDLVLCSQVLEHIPNDVSSIKNMASMTSKYLLITVPSGDYNSTSKLVGHVRHYSKEELISKVKLSGLKVSYVEEWGFPMHTIYKKALNILPENKKKQIGLGRYSASKKLLSDLLFYLFYLNMFNKGHNIILLAEKKSKNVE